MTHKLQFDFPAPPTLFPNIEILLHKTLRDHPVDYSILKEYPLVFSEQSSFKKNNGSLIGLIEGKIVTHLSLLIRQFVDAKSSEVLRAGFVSNVATHPQWQKRGYMTATFKHLNSIATKYNLDALLLWGDLSKFYQNLGYMSLGRERRYQLSLNALTQNRSKIEQFSDRNAVNTQILQLVDHQLSDDLLQNLLKLRPQQKINCLRETKEFRELLTIPDTYIFCGFVDSLPTAYVIIGRGKDFIGVIHEWGASSFSSLFEILKAVFASSQLSEILLLSPAELAEEFTIGLTALSKGVELHPMAMAKVFNTHKKEMLEEIFVWGLDSI